MRTTAIMMILLVLCADGAAAPRTSDSRAADRRAGGRAADRDDEADVHFADDDHDDNHDEFGGPAVPVVGPAISAVLSAAYIAAGLDHDPSGSWIRRARLAGLIPWVTVRTARDTSWQDAQAEVGHGTSLEVRATWRLDRLLFDNHELQVSTIGAARQRERRRLATGVIRSYFAWRRAAGAALGASNGRAAARAAEAAAELDAATDGWFSSELSRLQDETSGARTRRTPEP